MLAKTPDASKKKQISSSSSSSTRGGSSANPRSSRPHRSRTASADVYAGIGEPVSVPGQYEANQEQQFTVVGPISHRSIPGGHTHPSDAARRPRRRGSQRRRGSSPSISSVAPNANEEQGRRSVQRVEEERRLAKVAKAAHEAKMEAVAARRNSGLGRRPREVEKENTEGANGEDVGRLRRRSISEGLVSVLKRPSSSMSLRGKAAMQEQQQAGTSRASLDQGSSTATFPQPAVGELVPNVRWNPATRRAKSHGDVFFDAETGEMGSDFAGDDDGETAFSSVHGETAAVAHAAAIGSSMLVNLPGANGSSSSLGLGLGSSGRRRSSVSSIQRKAAPKPSVDELRAAYATTSMDPASPPPQSQATRPPLPARPSAALSRDPFAEFEPNRSNVEWVPSSRPLPTVPNQSRRMSGNFTTASPRSSFSLAPAMAAATTSAAVAGDKSAPLLPPIDTSDSLLALLSDRRGSGSSAAARPTVLGSPLGGVRVASPRPQSPPPATVTQQHPVSPPPMLRTRRSTNPFLPEDAGQVATRTSSDLPYLARQATGGASYSPTVYTASPQTPMTPGFATLPARNRTKSSGAFFGVGDAAGGPSYGYGPSFPPQQQQQPYGISPSSPSSPPPPRYSTIVPSAPPGGVAAPAGPRSPPLPPLLQQQQPQQQNQTGRPGYHQQQRASTMPMAMASGMAPPMSPPAHLASHYAATPAPAGSPVLQSNYAYHHQPYATYSPRSAAPAPMPASPMSPRNPYFAELHGDATGGSAMTPGSPFPAAVDSPSSPSSPAFRPAARTRAYSSNNPFARQAFVEQSQYQQQRQR